jgi:hypothetical protein
LCGYIVGTQHGEFSAKEIRVDGFGPTTIQVQPAIIGFEIRAAKIEQKVALGSENAPSLVLEDSKGLILEVSLGEAAVDSRAVRERVERVRHEFD